MFKRVVLFVAVNILVMVTLSILVAVLGIRPYLTSYGVDYGSLLAFCAVFGFGGALISLQLSRFAARMSMGVRLIDPEDPGNAEARELVNMVKHLTAEAGLPALPQIGVYDSPEVNAFATGPSRRRSLVAVSTGLLERMDRQAVRGVVAHELAHVANGDMVTMTLVQGVVNTFVMFFARVAAFAIGQAMRGRDDRRESGASIMLMHYVLVPVLEMAFMVLALPVVMFFSRWREFRADRGGADYAGTPTMVHALESLARSHGALDPRAPSLATMKISGPRRSWLGRLYLSHPPLEERIAALKQGR